MLLHNGRSDWPRKILATAERVQWRYRNQWESKRRFCNFCFFSSTFFLHAVKISHSSWLDFRVEALILWLSFFHHMDTLVFKLKNVKNWVIFERNFCFWLQLTSGRSLWFDSTRVLLEPDRPDFDMNRLYSSMFRPFLAKFNIFRPCSRVFEPC